MLKKVFQASDFLSYNNVVLTRNIQDKSAEKILNRNHASLISLTELIEKLLQSRDYEAAIGLIQVCGDFASRNHPGIFACHRLEGCLLEISKAILSLPRPDSIEIAGKCNSGKIAIHIMTEAHPVGGSTRLVRQWISNDSDRSHSIVLTAQGVSPIPELLQDTVNLSGGAIYLIDKTPQSKLDKAAQLRATVRNADLIVLHIHPHDSLALLALMHWRSRPLTVFMNHADHLFWLGAGIADHYMVFRDSGYQICVNRRAIPDERCSILPIPVPDHSIQISKKEAREQLEIPHETILCLTIGFSYKFHAVEENKHLVDVILPVFKQEENAELIAIGPSSEGRWIDGFKKSNGRIHAIGECSNIDVYLAAGDIFLMPMPIHSSSAALEAGIQGMPILVYTDPSLLGTVFDANSPGLSQSVLNLTTISEYRDCLTRLIVDEQFRREVGNQSRDTVHKYHGIAAWTRYLNRALVKARNTPIANANQVLDTGPQCQAEDRQLCRIQRGILARPAFILARHCQSMSLSKKLYIWWEYFHPLKSFVPKYSLIEIILLLVTPETASRLRVAFERNSFFRRFFLK